MEKIQIGLSKWRDSSSGKEHIYKYSDLHKEKIVDQNGWINNLNYLPIPFDLMHLELKNNSRIVSGWWTGRNWEGLRLKSDDEVIKWKRNFDYD